MEHPGEVWQELGYNGERIGGIDPITCDDDKVKIFSAAAVMLYRYVNGEVEYLFQHRSKYLESNPDKWDVSAGGHVNLGEQIIDAAIRETREEIGAEVDKDKLEIAAIFLKWKVMTCLYFYDWTGKEDIFHFDDQEVEEVKWVKYSELEGFLPKLKRHLAKDEIFSCYLREWNQKILEKYDNH